MAPALMLLMALVNHRFWRFGLCGSLLLASVGVQQLLTHWDSGLGFGLVFCRLWQFFAGMLVFFLIDMEKRAEQQSSGASIWPFVLAHQPAAGSHLELLPTTLFARTLHASIANPTLFTVGAILIVSLFCLQKLGPKRAMLQMAPLRTSTIPVSCIAAHTGGNTAPALGPATTVSAPSKHCCCVADIRSHFSAQKRSGLASTRGTDQCGHRAIGRFVLCVVLGALADDCFCQILLHH